jgi:ADP-ribose pyrophosphatase YjhB (NUDIX family)
MTNANYIADMRQLVGHQGMIFVTAFGVLWNDARDAILLEHRADSPDSGWGFPGGFLDYGESPMQAVVREFKEETGLNVEVVRVLGISTHITDKNAWGDAQENIAVGFEVQLVGGSIQADGDETLEVKWLPTHPEPKMFVPQAQRTMHKILTENESSDKAWFRENGE